jgi:hypothetical protein
MNRNDQVTLDQLVEGDRFFKAGDKKKTVLAVKQMKSKGSALSEVILCPGEQYGKEVKVVQIIKKPRDYLAIFLRHDIDII